MRVSIFSLLANTAIYSVAHRNAAQSASVKFAGFSFDLLNERAILYEPAPHLLHHGVVKVVSTLRPTLAGAWLDITDTVRAGVHFGMPF